MRTLLSPTLALLALLGAAPAVLALGPADVYLLVNKNAPDSLAVANHYCLRRGTPRANIITLDLPTGETMSRADFENKVLTPLRASLDKARVKVIVTTRGVPLRVEADDPTPAEKLQLAQVNKQLDDLRRREQELKDEIATLTPLAANDPKAAAQLKADRAELSRVQTNTATLLAKRRWLDHSEARACFDSDLALLWHGKFELRGFRPNPPYWRNTALAGGPPVIMTSRLDGPSLTIAKRLVDQAMMAEVRGLNGRLYVDAQGFTYDPRTDPVGLGVGGYDESMREMYRLFAPTMINKLENTRALFAPGACPNTALYVGWYSLGRYIDSFTFVPGAIGFHLASAEAATLRDPSTCWCKRMLDNNITVTLGPVNEPYTLGFPKPAEFFGFLGTGQFTLVESYWKSLRFGSWVMVLVGDPLYRPFAKNPKVKLNQIKPSPAGCQ
jgi:uncharacterized protein (TIGR03790 family)